MYFLRVNRILDYGKVWDFSSTEKCHCCDMRLGLQGMTRTPWRLEESRQRSDDTCTSRRPCRDHRCTNKHQNTHCIILFYLAMN